MDRMKRLITAVLLCALPLWSLSIFAGEKVNKTIDAPKQPSVHIEVVRGKVDIKTWDKSKIMVSGTLDEKSKGLIFTREGNLITIKDKLPNMFRSSNVTGSNLVITMPEDVTLDADGVSTQFKLAKLNGDIDVETVSGDLNASNLSGVIILSTVSGKVKADDLDGKIKLTSVSGKIEDENSKGRVRYSLVSGSLKSSSQAKDIEAELISGDLAAHFPKVNQLEIKLVSGDAQVKLAGDVERVRAESVSGDIELGFTTKPNANFEIEGGPGGDITNKLSRDKPKKQKYTNSESLNFSIGKASSSVKMSTISGELTVRTR